MKKQILMTAFGLLMTVLTAVAGDKYLVSVSGTCRTVSPADKIITRPFTTPTILRACANDTNSPSDVRQLRLLYDVDTDAIAVYNITTGQSVCPVFSYGESTIAGNLRDTARVRHVYLFNVPAVEGGIGSMVMTENIVRDGEGTELRRTTTGRFHYLVRATETTPPQVCTGTMTLGRKFALVTTP